MTKGPPIEHRSTAVGGEARRAPHGHGRVARRDVVQGLMGLASSGSAIAGARPAAAQGEAPTGFPPRPVRLVVTFAPGGQTDVLARLLAEHVAPYLGQPVVVENRPGAGGKLATEFVLQAPADGHTLLFAAPGHALAPHLYASLPYDPVRDFVTVALVAEVPMLIAAPPTLGVSDLAGLVALLRGAPPGRYAYGTSGVGSMAHIACAAFADTIGARVEHAPYRGSAPAIADLLAGRLAYMFDSVGILAEHVRAGRLVGLAAAGRARAKRLPEVPTFAEAGLPQFIEMANWNPWFAVHARAETPRPAIVRLNAEINRALAAPALLARFDELAVVSLGGVTPEAASAFIASQSERFGPIVRASGARLE